MGTLANTRDASLQTTAGAAAARGKPLATTSAAPTAFTMPAGVTPLAIGFVALVALLVYWDRRVVFRA
jgi:hypothetical protein